jgi:aryl sulfotransferase
MLRRYVSQVEDSARWDGFAFRDGDIVISTRTKCGTTWVQAICALLVFGRPDLPAPLAELSPWLDWSLTPRHEVLALLDAQRHRRIIKTHTPLDGVPIDPRVCYIVVGRHPLDVGVSLYHHMNNLDRDRMRELAARAGAAGWDDARTGPSPASVPRPELHEWLVDWLLEWPDAGDDPRDHLDSVPGILWHLGDAWNRRHAPNVVLLHYDDLQADRAGQMRALADRLEIDVPHARWPALVEAAEFTAMKAKADSFLPNRTGVLKTADAFFQAGRSGSGRALLTPDELSRYHDRTARLARGDLVAWLHRTPGRPAPHRST